jgi:hypothetical protein
LKKRRDKQQQKTVYIKNKVLILMGLMISLFLLNVNGNSAKFFPMSITQASNTTRIEAYFTGLTTLGKPSCPNKEYNYDEKVIYLVFESSIKIK